MNHNATITTLNDITLVTFQGFPAKVKSVSGIFEEIAAHKINIDMISMAPTHGTYTGLSLTISDEDLIKILAYTNKLKEQNVNVIVSSRNRKISIYDESMRDTPGIAAKVFTAITDTDADIRLITPSEVEISLLVTEADFNNVYEAIKKIYK